MRVVSLKINSNVYLLKNTNSCYLLLNTTIIPLYNGKISLMFLQTHPVCLHALEKFEKVESTNRQNDYGTTSKDEHIKRKQTCSLGFVNVFKF